MVPRRPRGEPDASPLSSGRAAPRDRHTRSGRDLDARVGRHGAEAIGNLQVLHIPVVSGARVPPHVRLDIIRSSIVRRQPVVVAAAGVPAIAGAGLQEAAELHDEVVRNGIPRLRRTVRRVDGPDVRGELVGGLATVPKKGLTKKALVARSPLVVDGEARCRFPGLGPGVDVERGPGGARHRRLAPGMPRQQDIIGMPVQQFVGARELLLRRLARGQPRGIGRDRRHHEKRLRAEGRHGMGVEVDVGVGCAQGHRHPLAEDPMELMEVLPRGIGQHDRVARGVERAQVPEPLALRHLAHALAGHDQQSVGLLLPLLRLQDVQQRVGQRAVQLPEDVGEGGRLLRLRRRYPEPEGKPHHQC